MLAAILVLGITVGQSSGQIWSDNAGNTYEIVYDEPKQPAYTQQQQYYPQQQRPYYPQQQQRPYYPQQQQQNYYPQQYPGNNYPQQTNNQQTPDVSVASAEWVCTNSRTKDIMIIAAEDNPGTRLNVPGSNQPNRPQPQPSDQPTFAQPPGSQPTFPSENPNVIPTTERPAGPIWPDFPATTTTTTQRPMGPIWPDFPTTTTPKPLDPIWTSGDDGSYKPGFTVEEPTPPPKPTARPTTARPSTTTQAPDDYDDDEPIKIDFGK